MRHLLMIGLVDPLKTCDILKDYRLFLIFLFFVHLTVRAMPAEAQGYGYTSDVEQLATVGSAQRIIGENGGLFFGPADLRKLFKTQSIRLPHRLPFTERMIFDCGVCVLFPTVSHVGYRKAKTDILSLLRAPEAKRLFRWGHSRRIPWFKDESFATRPLRTQWHLVRLNVEDKGTSYKRQIFYRGQERPVAAAVGFWMLLLLPRDSFVGEYFYTSELVHSGRDVVIIGRPEPGAIDIYFTPKDISRKGTGRVVEFIPAR